MTLQKMKAVWLKNAELLNPVKHTRKSADIVIKNGLIERIGKPPESFSGDIIDLKHYIITPGLIDIHVHLREPGREDLETVETGCASARAGGFTALAAMPNTQPPCDNHQVVHFLKKKSEKELIDVYPIGAITKGRKGVEISEIADLYYAGAVAFSDDGSTPVNSLVMRYALEYASMYQAPIIDHCEDCVLANQGHMNEGIMSTRLGITGIPNASESVIIARDIELVRLTGSPLHVAHLSTREGVELIRRAKQEGLPVTCEVTPHHLLFTENDLIGFDTNLKMNPPLRTQKDVDALLEGIVDGTVDVFASDHAPHALQEKQVEFEAAPFGIIGVQSMLGVILKTVVESGVLSLEQAIEKMCVTPRKLLNLPVPQIKVGEPANLTIFNPEESTILRKQDIKSLSQNSPYIDMELPGRIYGVCNKGLMSINS